MQGHPLCKFCRQRFYDSNELYRHMESAHEHCFLCRRENPGQYVYYRHYKELEGGSSYHLHSRNACSKMLPWPKWCRQHCHHLQLRSRCLHAELPFSLLCRPLPHRPPPVPSLNLPGQEVCCVYNRSALVAMKAHDMSRCRSPSAVMAVPALLQSSEVLQRDGCECRGSTDQGMICDVVAPVLQCAWL